MRGYKINMFSHYGEQEKEVLFPPFSRFCFVCCSQNCHPDGSDDLGADMIVLQQTADAAPAASAAAKQIVSPVAT